jgi:hypothetical protein
MDVSSKASPSAELSDVAAQCAECERAAANLILSRSGASICPECIKSYYAACSVCGGFIPQDEALSRNDLIYCADCFAKPADKAAAGTVNETLIESLIAEYVSLHAEEKRLSERMEVIKEQLKSAAAGRQREGSAVTLRAGDEAVRCSYRAALKCDTESVEALAEVLDEEQFSTLFERKVSFNPVKDGIARLLSSTDEAAQEVREAVRAAVRETEIVTLSVMTTRK